MPEILISIFSLVFGCSIIAGVLLGFAIFSDSSRIGLKAAFHSILRIVIKTTKKKGNFAVDPFYAQRDKNFVLLPMKVKSDLIDKKALNAVTQLKECLVKEYGSQVAEVYLYGSRVRGDYYPDSDVDVAVLFTAVDDYLKIKRDILHYTLELLVKHGLYIQSRIYDKRLLDSTNNSSNCLLETILRYGVLV